MNGDAGGFQRRNDDGPEEQAFPHGNGEGPLGSDPVPSREQAEDEIIPRGIFSEPAGPAQLEATTAPDAAPSSEEAPLPHPDGEEATAGHPAPHPEDSDGVLLDDQAAAPLDTDLDLDPAPTSKPEKPTEREWPEEYLSAKEEFYIERPTSAAHASYQRPGWFTELDTDKANVVVQAGDAIEDAGSFKDLRGALVEHYDIRGPIETLLLERLVELAWRLRRIQSIERGLIEDQTIGLRSRLLVDRVQKAKREQRFAALHSGNNPFAATNPYVVRLAKDKVAELVAVLEDGEVDLKLIFQDLCVAMGRDNEQLPHNVGGAVAWLIFGAPKHGVTNEQIHAELITILRELVENLDKHETLLTRDMDELDQAQVEGLRGVTDPQRLRALSAAERALQAQMLEVLGELERRVRCRRVGEGISSLSCN